MTGLTHGAGDDNPLDATGMALFSFISRLGNVMYNKTGKLIFRVNG
jgi:hypothetical protein